MSQIVASYTIDIWRQAFCSSPLFPETTARENYCNRANVIKLCHVSTVNFAINFEKTRNHINFLTTYDLLAPTVALIVMMFY